jgi:hypothetical protein
MNRTPIAASLAVALAAGSAAAADAPRLTVYSGDYDAVAQSTPMPGGPGFALYETTLSFDLAAGDNVESLGGLPTALDAGSVRLKPRGDARVRGQRFDFAIAGQDELLRRAIGRTITVEQDIGGTRQTHTGVLLAAGNGLTLRLPDGRIKVLSSYAGFDLPELPGGVVAEPTLTWTIAAGRAGAQAFDLAYATAGLGWRAEYQADVRDHGTACRMDFEGAAMIANRSGADFRDVALTLVAGEPNRANQGNVMMAKAERAEMMVADQAVAASPSGEYHAYRLPGTGDVPQNSVQRLPLVDPAREVPCERRYETRAPIGGWVPPHPIVEPGFAGDGGEQPVTASVRFENAKSAGLGVPLPAGRVRVFEGGELLGEAGIGHTPAGRRLDMVVGTVFDLTAERKRLDFDLDREGRTMTEKVGITVRNAKSAAATVHVIEPLPRWSDWEIVDGTVPATKTDAQTATFAVEVPAGGERVLEYTVRYRWAPDVTIP